MSIGPSRRDSNEPAIVAALQAAGCAIRYMDRLPWDLTVGRAGRVYLLEIKTKTGRLRKSQEVFLQDWPGHYAIVRTPEEALKAVEL